MRPDGLGDKATFTDAEAASFEREENQRQNRDLIDPKKGGLQYLPGSVIPYNEFWYERGSRIVGSKRTSLIVDPPDGRIPPLTARSQRSRMPTPRSRERQLGRVRADSPQARSLADRCILGFNAGPPMTPGAYNNHVQITHRHRANVILIAEMVHDARVIPVEGSVRICRRACAITPATHAATGKPDAGDRHDEFSARNELPWLECEPAPDGVVSRASTPTRCCNEFTVYDPQTWTKPWSVAVPMRKSDQRCTNTRATRQLRDAEHPQWRSRPGREITTAVARRSAAALRALAR
jgi:hypothetical protein